MKIKEITEWLSERYPASLAMSWDNPGLQVGRAEREAEKIYVALDATEEVIGECIQWGAQLLVTHHPLLMSGIRRVCGDDMAGRKILMLAENKIAHFAMHTNYDVTEMWKLAAGKMELASVEVLEQTGVREDGTVCGIGFWGRLPQKMTVAQCCEYVKKAFGLPTVRVFGDLDLEIERIAVSPGSGKSMIAPALAAGAQLLITGDIGHHDGLDAVDRGMAVMDAGHYGLEHIFIAQITDCLKQAFPELEVRAAEIRQPFAVV